MKNNIYIEAIVTTYQTVELSPEDFEEVYADGKRECAPEDDLVGYMCDALMDKVDNRVDGYDAQYPGAYEYLESLVKDFIHEKENK